MRSLEYGPRACKTERTGRTESGDHNDACDARGSHMRQFSGKVHEFLETVLTRSCIAKGNLKDPGWKRSTSNIDNDGHLTQTELKACSTMRALARVGYRT